MFSDALVTPSSTGSAVAGSPPSASTWRFLSSNSNRSTSSPGSSSVSPGLVDAQLAQHLAHDDLDVLVVDVHTLRAVDLLDLVHQVPLHRLAALDAQHLLGVLRALGELVAGLDGLAVLDLRARRGGHRVLALLALLGGDRDLARRATSAEPVRRATIGVSSSLSERGERLADLDPRAVLDRRLDSPWAARARRGRSRARRP